MTMPPWSYSSLTKFENCPRQYQLVKVTKAVQDKQTEATLWGNKVHQAIENRILKKTPLPEGMEKWERIVSKFDTPKGRVFTETQFSLTKNLSTCKWTDKSCWVRGIVDVGVDAGDTAVALDWKTGKVKHDHDQLRLFAGLLMQTYPYIQRVKTGYVWLQFNKLTKETFSREDLPSIWEGFIMRSRRLEAAYEKDKWPAKPSGLCPWCPATNKHCEFSPK